MSSASLNLVVIKSPDIEALCGFYSALGLEFTKHAHGSGPEHYSAESGASVFEIYPQTDADSSTIATRLGFKVNLLDDLLPRLIQLGGKVVSPAKQSPWGKRAVVVDPIGHKVELVEAEATSTSS
jgi:lactoylglutathione lyase